MAKKSKKSMKSMKSMKPMKSMKSSKCARWKCIAVKVLAVIGALTVIIWAVCGIAKVIKYSQHGGSYTMEHKAEYKANKMAKRMDLDDAQKAAVEKAMLKYFASKKTGRENLLRDMKDILPADKYAKIEKKMARKMKKRGEK